jgi:DnaJ family protein C protein 7
MKNIRKSQLMKEEAAVVFKSGDFTKALDAH